MQKNTIKNISLYQTNYKFNRNIEILDSDKVQFFMIPQNYSIHKYVMTNRHISESSTFIFNASLINSEIVQFIESFHEKLNIYILLDQEFARNLNLKVKYIECPKYLINKQLYSGVGAPKVDRISYFFNNSNSELDPKLASLLYPNTKLNINIFDAHNIKHPLSLGFLNEKDKRDVLYSSQYYLHDNNNYYVAEALAAGCICLNLDSEEAIDNQITKQSNTSYYLEIQKQTLDYRNYIEDLIYE